MDRDFVINGETLVRVKGGMHTSTFQSGNISTITELGLTTDQIRVIPRFIHKDIRVDDFGPEIPAEVMQYLADVIIKTNLIHYDPIILDTCLAESQTWATGTFAGTLAPAGSVLGNNLPLFSSGCHYISLNLSSPVLGLPWRFPTSYLTGPPVEIPMGTDATIVKCNWRAIPYTTSLPSVISPGTGVIFDGSANSSGRVLWDHKVDN